MLLLIKLMIMPLTLPWTFNYICFFSIFSMFSLFSDVNANSEGRFDIDDLLALRELSELAVSPDGDFLAYTVTAYDLDKDTQRDRVWMVPADGGEAVPMTSSNPEPIVRQMMTLLESADARRDQTEALQRVCAPFDGHDAGLEAAEAIMEIAQLRSDGA